MTQREQLRHAVESSDYVRALQLWREYTAAIVAAGPTRESLGDATALIEWARPLLIATRADAVQRLRGMHASGAYGKCPAVRGALFRTSF
jgi:hypothetical protein